MPAVQEMAKKIFQQEPVSTVNVDEVVALGAALYAAHKSDGSNLSEIQKKSIEKLKVAERTSSSSERYRWVTLNRKVKH